MQSKTIVKILMLSIVIYSCKREKFDESYSKLFGKWKWTFSLKSTGTITVISASSVGNYSVELSNKCIVCKKDGKNDFKRKFKTISEAQKDNTTDTTTYGFSITTSKNENIVISYIPNKDMLKVSGYPYTYIDSKEFTSKGDYDSYYTNYYVRE